MFAIDARGLRTRRVYNSCFVSVGFIVFAYIWQKGWPGFCVGCARGEESTASACSTPGVAEPPQPGSADSPSPWEHILYTPLHKALSATLLSKRNQRRHSRKLFIKLLSVMLVLKPSRHSRLGHHGSVTYMSRLGTCKFYCPEDYTSIQTSKIPESYIDAPTRPQK